MGLIIISYSISYSWRNRLQAKLGGSQDCSLLANCSEAEFE